MEKDFDKKMNSHLKKGIAMGLSSLAIFQNASSAMVSASGNNTLVSSRNILSNKAKNKVKKVLIGAAVVAGSMATVGGLKKAVEIGAENNLKDLLCKAYEIWWISKKFHEKGYKYIYILSVEVEEFFLEVAKSDAPTIREGLFREFNKRYKDETDRHAAKKIFKKYIEYNENTVLRAPSYQDMFRMPRALSSCKRQLSEEDFKYLLCKAYEIWWFSKKNPPKGWEYTHLFSAELEELFSNAASSNAPTIEEGLFEEFNKRYKDDTHREGAVELLIDMIRSNIDLLVERSSYQNSLEKPSSPSSGSTTQPSLTSQTPQNNDMYRGTTPGSGIVNALEKILDEIQKQENNVNQTSLEMLRQSIDKAESLRKSDIDSQYLKIEQLKEQIRQIEETLSKNAVADQQSELQQLKQKMEAFEKQCRDDISAQKSQIEKLKTQCSHISQIPSKGNVDDLRQQITQLKRQAETLDVQCHSGIVSQQRQIEQLKKQVDTLKKQCEQIEKATQK